MKKSRQITFRSGGDWLDGQIQKREVGSSPSLVARRDLGRYYQALSRALKEVDLTEAEASAICDANNGSFWTEDHVPDSMLWANVADSIGLGEKWGIDREELVKKIRVWPQIQRLAVIDAVERFWAECQTATVQSVGLVK